MKSFSFVFLFLMSFVSAIEADFNCPKSVVIDEEFPCYLIVKDINGAYDVKVEITEEGKTIAKIFNPYEEEWQSTYYYLKEFIMDGKKKEVYLKIEREGKFDGILKLRQGDKREFFDFEIEVIGKKTSKEKSEKIITNNLLQTEEKSIEKFPENKNIISLNNLSKNATKTQLVYESKNYKVIKFLPYAFSLLLIFIIVILLWDKF